MTADHRRRPPAYLSLDDCRLDDFIAHVDRITDADAYPLASEIACNLPVYDRAVILAAHRGADSRKALFSEWIEAMTTGPGAVVLRGAYDDTAPVDAATAQFQAMIAEQRAANSGGADHFGKPGANDRIWNALEKLALRAPETFAAYYGNPIIALISEAWLGPAYQITSQINVVNPGGEAQVPHRDYHIGFLNPDMLERFPAHVHRLSPVLTLQGAVAHCDMPLESGPTLYLPYSQSYLPGYFAMQKPEFREYFAAHHVQMALAKGDAIFFNPALMHAAGSNRSRDIRRMANLLQVSSAYGRAMESVDRTAMSAALYPVLQTMTDAEAISAVIAASAEGYAFPVNLDRAPPVGGLAPESQQALIRRALASGWDAETTRAALREHHAKTLT